jgi:hypothetical protein
MNKIRYWIDLLNPFNVDKVIKNVTDSISNIEERLSDIETRIECNIETIKKDITFYKTMASTIGDTVPDMIWLKDKFGVYHYANKSIRENLLFDDDPTGKNDYTLSSRAKQKFGPTNHTFGEICANSDIVILKNLQPQRFLESGKIKGKMMYLEVFKAPFYLDGELFGVCGVGRDMSEYVEAFRAHNCSGCKQMNDIFEKYEFTDGE